ncbi:MAG: CYTH domain-containing protein [Planctomycetaceae bacterium]|nr:CYTH domain-containing protein [Planctomycetaceae bacterium]
MPTNVEIKAWVHDPDALAALARRWSDAPPEIFHQRDTFFGCPHGRLKLRELGSGAGELIWYDRPDTAGSKRSDYRLAAIADPATLRDILERACGVTQVVEKMRTLCIVGQTRIHLDEVVGLGSFVELEVVLHDGQAESEGHRIAAELMARLGIAATDLLTGAYAEMLPRDV